MKLFTALSILCLCRFSFAQLYFASFPQSIHFSSTSETVKARDVSHIVSYLMGYSTHSASSWKGVESLDMFQRPKANMFISVLVPAGVNLSFREQYPIQYEIQEGGESTYVSMEEFNLMLYQSYRDQKPLVLDFEQDQQVFNTVVYGHDMFADLPVTLTEMKQHINSSALRLSINSCLDPTQDTDAMFLGELQLLEDILAKVMLNKEVVDDNVPDSFYFALSGLNSLVQVYGEKSCQVVAATNILQIFLPEFVVSFNELYSSGLLAELNLVRSMPHSFQQVRMRRSVLQTAPQPSIINDTLIKDLAEPNSPEMAIVINIVAWVVIGIALAVLAASYFIWFMDPGRDSIIYRMTTQRMKAD